MKAIQRKIILVLAVLLTVVPAVADTVITVREVISCSVVSVDSNFVRTKLPQGGIRMLLTREVYEIRLPDSARAAGLAAQFPMIVKLDSGQVIPPPAVRVHALGLDAPVEPPLAAAELARWKRKGFTDGVILTPVQSLLATGGSCGLGLTGCLLFPSSPIFPTALGASAGCLSGCALASPKSKPPSTGQAARQAYMNGFRTGAGVSGGIALLTGALTGAMVSWAIAFIAIEKGLN